MSLILGCCREIISTGLPSFHQGVGDVVSNNKRSLMMISSSIEKQNNNNHLSCFSVDPTDFSSSDKSSIGGDSDDDLDIDECNSSNVSQTKFSMDSLEESLPIKRGLSNYFSGRSKSFANLSEATSVTSLAKAENPFNKRRRTLMACRRKSSRRKTFYSCTSSTTIISPVSMPLLKLNEDDEDENQTETDDDDEQQVQVKIKMNHNINKEEEEEEEEEEEVELSQIEEHEDGRIKRFKAPRCFSLTDLHYHQ